MLLPFTIHMLLIDDRRGNDAAAHGSQDARGRPAKQAAPAAQAQAAQAQAAQAQAAQEAQALSIHGAKRLWDGGACTSSPSTSGSSPAPATTTTATRILLNPTCYTGRALPTTPRGSWAPTPLYYHEGGRGRALLDPLLSQGGIFGSLGYRRDPSVV